MPADRADEDAGRLRFRIAALEKLLQDDRQEMQEQSARLERARLESDRRAAEMELSQRALREKTRILELILESMGDGLVVADESGRFQHFNPAAERIVGQGALNAPPTEWPDRYGLYLQDTTTPFPHDRLPLVRAMRGESVDEEMLFVRGPRMPRGAWLSVNARPLRGEADEPRGGVVVFRDVTARVQAEEALGRKALELERSNAELKQFADVASHDLQAPLRLIKSYVEILARRYADRLDPEANRYVAHIVESTTQMMTLVNDLLALSRAGAPGPAPQSVDTEAVCDRAIANLSAAIESERAAVTRGPLPAVEGDETQLQQLFQNLIGNAIKFHSGRPPRVHVSAARRGGETIISVQDDGIGIAPGSLEEIFLMFKRLPGPKRYPGSGIGLAICKKIVERHGGRIWAESLPGQGAAFHFALPLHERDPESAP